MKQKLLILFAALMLSTSMWALTMEDGYYLIGTAQDLKDFAALVNAGNTTINGKLTANIDLQGSSSNQWTPIGNGTYPYNGTFDGQGFTVSNLYYHQEVHNVGFFGHAGSSARIKNIRAVVDIDNTGNGATACCGATSAGGILGSGAEGTLIINCSVAGSVISFSNVGGIVGYGSVTVVNSYNEATVKFYNNNGQVGCGIHGYGGTPTLINCYNVGKVINTGPSATSHMGNIAIFATVTNCYSLENSCQNGAGAAWSNKANNGITGTTMTAADMQNSSFMNTLYSNALALWSTYQDIDTWMQDPTTGRPILNLSYRPTEGPWTRIGENSGCCSVNVCTTISWNGLNNSQWNGTVIPFKDNTNGIGTIMQGTAYMWQNQIIFTLYETTQTVPSYSKKVWNWNFQMKGHYQGLAQQTGLYAHPDLSTLQNTALDFTHQNETNAGHEICVGLFYHNAGYLGQDVTQNHNHNFEFDNRNGGADLQQPVYMIQTHFAMNSSGDYAVFGPGWVSFKDVSSSYTYYYYKHITFNANGGSGSMAQQTIENSGNLTANSFTRANCVFTGWNTSADGSGTAYSNQAAITATTSSKGPVTLYAQWTFEGSGTAEDPYLIPSTDVWNLLADKVNSGTNYAGKFFRQTADISVTTMVGYFNDDNSDAFKEFSGTYDGDGHTLTLNYTSSHMECAPFRFVDGVTIKNLHIAGTITTSAKDAAGLIGRLKTGSGITNIINCRSSVTISSSVNGDGTHGGFVAITRTKRDQTTTEGAAGLNFTGCVFDGELLGASTNSSGGFVGWTETATTLNFTDCVFAPTTVTIGTGGSTTFARVRNSTSFHSTNSYYKQTFGGTQGKQLRSITGGTGVTVANAGTATTYNVSGITSYGTGISYGGVLYGGSGDAVNLNLDHADAATGYSFSGYNADYGTLTGSDNPYTLTMADANAVIAAEWEVNPSVSLSDNDATMPSILSALNDGNARDITINRPLLRNGDYNTLCVPFSLSAEQLAEVDCPLYNCSISKLTDMWVAGNELRLLMSPVSSIEAGKPYLVRYKGEASKLTEMVFNGVTVSASAGCTTNANGATMYGVLEPTSLVANNQNYLFLVAGNQLNWPNVDSPIKSFRAYFVVDGSNNGGSAPVRRGMPARIVEHYDTATDVEDIRGQMSDIRCQKIICDGQLIIIRNGVEYNAQGQLIK